MSTCVVWGLEVGLAFDVEPGAGPEGVGASLIVLKGRPVRLDCVPAPLGGSSVAWLKDDVRLVNSSHYTVLGNGSLLIDKAISKKGGTGQTDNGVYRCLISNSIGALVSRPTRLRVAGMAPDFSRKPPNPILGATGDVILLTCSIESVPSAAISWQRDNKPLLPQPNKYVITASGSLYILAASLDDGGNYSCAATNPLTGKTKTAPESLLTVVPRSSPPGGRIEFLDEAPLALTRREGEALVLECAARGRPGTPLVEWVFVPSAGGRGVQPTKPSSETGDGARTTAASHSEVVLSSEYHSGLSLLSLSNLTLDQSGNYTCRARMDDSEPPVYGPTHQIEVVRPPRMLSRPKSVSHPIAKTARFECDAEGVPKPNLVWLKNGKRLVINGRIKQRARELLMSNSVSDDSAIYQCVASNAGGEVWASARLIINAPKFPFNPPTNLRCTPLGPTEIQLSWDFVPIPTNPVKAFTIHFLPTNGGDEKQEVATSKSFTIKKLEPYTNYSFYVRAYGISASEQSSRVTCLTLESVPVATPTLLFPTLAATWLNVTWLPLPYTTARGDIVQYKIQWRRKDTHNVSHLDLVPGNVTHYVITDILPDTSYEVRVLARTSQGFPTKASHIGWFTIHTPPDPHLPTPTLSVTTVNTTSAEGVACPSKPRGFTKRIEGEESLQGWRITLDGGEGVGRRLFLERETNSCELHDLDPNIVYKVHLVGLFLNSITTAPALQYLYTGPPTTLLPTLAPPTGLEANFDSASSINLSWDPSDTDVDHYLVSISPAGSDMEKILQTTSNFVVVPDLQPYTWYVMKVKVTTTQGQYSEYSQSLEVRTLQGAPSPVRDIGAKALNQTAIAVTWKPPAELNGVLSMYLLSFSLDLDLPLSSWPFVQVGGLQPQSTYFLTVRAVTQAGVSESSSPLTIVTQVPDSTSLLSPYPPGYNDTPSSTHADQLLGIIVGCSIGACCIALCTGTLLYKRRCSKPRSSLHQTRRPHGAGSGGGVNGSGAGGLCRVSPQRRAAGDQMYEMEYLGKQHGMHDTYPNGGVRLPLISNGRVPNGGTPTIVRITENPHHKFSSSDLEGDREGGGGSGEADSLLSAGGLDDTHLTTLETSGGPGEGGGDSGFCGGGDDRLAPPLERYAPPTGHSPTSVYTTGPNTGHSPPSVYTTGHVTPSPTKDLPRVPSSPLPMDLLVDDGFHEVLTSLPEATRFCTRSAGGGVASKC
ncbi:hypothetical protein M8J75_003516 [Diaphorina citri]|nr:hypothetical protein M8J75_003516 [Diaphorina citri]